MLLRKVQPIARGVFRYPIHPPPKITVVGDTLRVPPGYRQADTIAAPASWLLNWDTEGWSPTFPIVVFTGTRHGFLESNQREEIWRRFGVPLFEQLVDDDGRIIASECEAHEGLHLDPVFHHTFGRGELFLEGRPSGIAAIEKKGLCGCGKPGARISNAACAIRETLVA